MKVACSEVREKDVARHDIGSKQAVCDPGFLGEVVPAYFSDGLDVGHEIVSPFFGLVN